MVEHLFLILGWTLLMFCFQQRNVFELRARQESTATDVYKALVETTNREAHEYWRENNRLRALLNAYRKDLSGQEAIT